MSLPILDYLTETYGKYDMHFSIAQKCKQSYKLFLNHPNITDIKISDHWEDLGNNDIDIMNKCDIVFNVRPNHPAQQDWYNFRNCVEETVLMAGLNPDIFSKKTPRLFQYWKDPKISNKKTIAIWPFAGYGQGSQRSPSIQWYEQKVQVGYSYLLIPMILLQNVANFSQILPNQNSINHTKTFFVAS
jgi:hypothetical protein